MSRFRSFARPWLAGQTLLKEDPGRQDGGLPGALIAAVAGIVSVAAAKARRTGQFGALRDAIEAALDPANDSDPREAGQPDLPRIADADPLLETLRLRALAARTG